MNRDYWPTKNWEFSNEKFSNSEIEKLHLKIQNGYSNIAGIVVVQNGYIKYEDYFHNHNEAEKFPVASVTKTIISSLFGIALKNKDIVSLDEKILNYFPEYNTDNNVKKDIRIKDLITMTAPFPFETIDEPIDKLVYSKDWMKYSLDILASDKGRRTFKYSTIGTHILSGVLTKATGFSAREYANKELFNKIGMSIIPFYKMSGFTFEDVFGERAKGWLYDPQYYTVGGYGITLSPRDMAKFGYLYLNNGIWNNIKIFPSNWVKESTTKEKYDYGYLWWLYRDKDIESYCAMGTGGHCICVIPKLDAVVSIASDYAPRARNRWIFIKKNIIPLLK